MKLPNYPALESLQELKQHFATGRDAVLVAPPGSGKTTVVPLGLLGEPWLQGKKILMLQPRRIAARACATRMAELLGEAPGQTVGYSIRFERRVSSATRIEILTEGLLCRRLQQDAELQGVGLVIFDEFHERSLHADLAIALTLDAREHLSPDLRLLVMSATLDGHAISELLGQAPIASAGGKMFPVQTHFDPPRRDEPLEQTVTRVTQRALQESTGDVLVFLPGVREIDRAQRHLVQACPRVRTLPLHGSLPSAQQDEAIRPAENQTQRKIILATNVAQTSLTVPGISAVVDSGLARVSVFDPASGSNRLETRRISRASADQRAGRSGRTGPGTVYRLWSQDQSGAMAAFDEAEVQRADLCRLALELAVWGVRKPSELLWLDPPEGQRWDYAVNQLQTLGAIDSVGKATGHGRLLNRLPSHPRLAHLMVWATRNNLASEGASLAAALDIRPAREHRDLADHLAHLQSLPASHGVGGSFRRARDQFQRLLAKQKADPSTSGPQSLAVARDDSLGLLTAIAFPERLARRRSDTSSGRPTPDRASAAEVAYLCADGGEARISQHDPLAQSRWLAIAHWIPGAQRKISLATPISQHCVLDSQRHRLNERCQVEWSVSESRVIAETQSRLGAIVLSQRSLDSGDERIAKAMLQGIRQMGLGCLPWGESAQMLRTRVACVRQWKPEQAWPDLSDAALLASLENWLLPYLSGVSRLSHLKSLNMPSIVQSLLSYAEVSHLDRLAPIALTVPSGQKKQVHYMDSQTPILKVKLQEMFGCLKTPSVCEGQIPVQVHLLSPAQRPIAVTQDLAGFWDGPYQEVRKELRGRYPKHPWPEDPRSAVATHKAKPRKA